MPRSDPTPVWVLQKTREIVARATPAHIIAGIITAAGYPATERQVRRWKVKHGIRSQWADDDGPDGTVRYGIPTPSMEHRASL